MEETNSIVVSSVDVVVTPITVVDWIDYEDADKYPCSVGGTGGWFKEKMRWNDYLDNMPEELHPYYQALFNEFKEHGIDICGDDHQGDCGVPLFSDDTCGVFSYRAWGDLMAAAQSTIQDKDFHYMDFYCS
jgi:hypothetical protein